MSTAKRLFLVDAMAHIYRAFYAPMLRMNAPSGMPTKVPFLFNNILKRILKDYKPEYLGIVFDPSGPTFRDKLFEQYKAHREPMPDEMRVQLPYVKKLCEAMRLPILEVQGFEADDVIGTLAVKAAKSNLEVLIVSNDKDMMQLVGKNVRTLRTGSGGAKADVIVDETRVTEILGVPAERVVDYMALVGDTVDNIPGAKGIGEKGAAELIQKYGSVENALDHAGEVPNKRYREALQQQREQVMMSKQLATIATDVPLELDLSALERRAPDGNALAALYRELGFNSLLRVICLRGRFGIRWRGRRHRFRPQFPEQRIETKFAIERRESIPIGRAAFQRGQVEFQRHIRGNRRKLLGHHHLLALLLERFAISLVWNFTGMVERVFHAPVFLNQFGRAFFADAFCARNVVHRVAQQRH